MKGKDRREVLKSSASALAAGATLALGFPVFAAKKIKPAKMPPQIGDYLVFPSWEGDGKRVTLADVPISEAPLLAYPQDPETDVIRERSRRNQLLLARFDEAALDEKTRSYAVNGVLAYSGMCTHTGCGVSEWNAESKNFLCPCHSSEFDPRQSAKVIGGPATRALPLLKIAQDDIGFVVAGEFSGAVGPPRKK
ncbi:MAG: Rieske (2Fe-2S) protein [Pseudomonadota bacterium]